MSDFTAFTFTASKAMPRIIIDVHIGLATEHPVAIDDLQLTKISAMWDTSREKTVISPHLMLKLIADKSELLKQQVPVDIYLPNRIRIAGIPMDMTILDEGLDCCLGMDIISLGDLSLSYFEGKTQFSFRVPGLGGTDYVELHSSNQKQPTSTSTSKAKKSIVVTGRGAMCPCGSGKKHKNCCAKLH